MKRMLKRHSGTRLGGRVARPESSKGVPAAAIASTPFE